MAIIHDLLQGLVTRDTDGTSVVVHLFRGPYVTDDGEPVDVAEGCKRLLVFVALHRARVERRYAAGALWPVGDEERASGNLRSSLWRLNRCMGDLVVADKHSLALRADVLVDMHLLDDWASRVISGSTSAADLAALPTGINPIDLLPGWYEDWVLMERERIRQRMLHALESMSYTLSADGRHAEAVDAAMLAVRAEPLRESAQCALLEAHLAEGNLVEGRRSLESYRRLLDRELGVAPAPRLELLVRGQRSFTNSRRPAHPPYPRVHRSAAAERAGGA